MAVPFQAQVGRNEIFFLRGGTLRKEYERKKNVLWLEHILPCHCNEIKQKARKGKDNGKALQGNEYSCLISLQFWGVLERPFKFSTATPTVCKKN